MVTIYLLLIHTQAVVCNVLLSSIFLPYLLLFSLFNLGASSLAGKHKRNFDGNKLRFGSL